MLKKIIDFSKFSSVRIGSICEVEIVDEKSKFSGIMIGGANNILVSPNPPKLGILDNKFDFIKFENGILRIGAKTKSAKIYNFTKQHNIKGFEFLAGIPGTLGGLLIMNAGLCRYNISDNLINLKTNLSIFNKDDIKFEYRKSDIKGIIFEANFNAISGFDNEICKNIASKRSNQPKGYSFGSCFKNPPNDSAGRLIELSGLKGYRYGNCGFSEKHANFLINYGGGSYEEAMHLINLAKKLTYEKFGVLLQTEVVII
nr:UDP-N-acetylmuramate dehydrogenase [Campylobacter sputorum]